MKKIKKSKKDPLQRDLSYLFSKKGWKSIKFALRSKKN